MMTNTPGAATKGLARHLAVVGIAAIGIVGCAPATALRSDATVASTAPSPLPTISEVLNSDSRFTDYIRVVDFAGLGQRLENAHGVTVFAPTNAAFERAEPHWRATANPDTDSNGGAWAQKRQKLIEQSVLDGVHPPSDFSGQMQDVRAVNGSIFHVDGRQPGTISITTGSTVRGMGYGRTTPRVAKAELPPIAARDGLIYPVDNILIR